MNRKARLAVSLGTRIYVFIAVVMTAFFIGGAIGLGKAKEPGYMKTAFIAGGLWPASLIYTAIHFDDMANKAKGVHR
jgi:hypothetical protein